jgi:hypothetical protein
MRYITILLMVLGLAACGGSQPDDRGNDRGAQKKAFAMVGFVQSDPLLSSYPRACPVNVYRAATSSPDNVADCSKRPRECISQCKNGNSKACFDATQIVEAGSSPDDNLATYPLYMRACAVGDGNACVNAGAAVKNTVWSEGKSEQAATPQCQLETFSTMCTAGHAWGCYMAAQEYKRGGFDGQSDAKYEENMRSACKVSKTSGACYPAFH